MTAAGEFSIILGYMCTLEFRWHRKIIFRKESSDETDISAKEKTKNERTRL